MLIRDGIDLAVRRLALAERSTTVARAADVAAAISDLQATTCIIDLEADDAAELPQLLHLRAVGVCKTFDAAAARRAFALGLRTVVTDAEGLDALLASLRPQGGSSTSFTPSAPDKPLLSHFERSVLHLISQGATARSVAAALAVTVSRVDAAKRRAFRKLGVQHQSHAIAAALQRGLLPLGVEVPSRPGSGRPA